MKGKYPHQKCRILVSLRGKNGSDVYRVCLNKIAGFWEECAVQFFLSHHLAYESAKQAKAEDRPFGLLVIESGHDLPALIDKFVSMDPDLKIVAFGPGPPVGLYKSISSRAISNLLLHLPPPKAPNEIEPIFQSLLAGLSIHEKQGAVSKHPPRSIGPLEIDRDWFQALVEQSFDGLVIHDGQYILYGNPGAARLFGYSPEELTGMDFRELCHSESVELLWARAQARLRGEKPPSKYEIKLVHRNGSFFEAEINASRIDSGDRVAIQTWIKDISEYVRAKRKLESSHSLIEAALDSTTEGIIVLDLQGQIIRYNNKYLHMWNLAKDDMIDCSSIGALKLVLDRLIEPRQFAAQVSSCVFDPQKESRGQLELKNGRIFDVTTLPQKMGDRSVGRVWSFSDVSDSINVLSALKESERRYRDLFDNISDLIYVHDMDGALLAANEAVCRVSGYSQDDIMGASFKNMAPEKYRAKVFEEYFQDLQTKGHAEGVSFYYDINGQRRYLEYKSTLVREHGQAPVVRGSARDITERVLAEREMKALEERLLHSQKMEAIGTLAGGIAHDFNNIATGIFGNIELALNKLGPNQEISRHLAAAFQAAGRVRDLTRHLLTFSRKTKPLAISLDLSVVIDETVNLLRKTIDRRITISTEVSPDLWLIEADQSQAGQMLMNLCLNAKDALEAKIESLSIQSDLLGSEYLIIIQAENTYLSKSEADETVGAGPGGYVALSVLDTGLGMNQETRQRIFEPFFTTKPINQASGLGLAAVYGIVHQHKGFITVDSAPGRGTEFRLFFPSRTAEKRIELPTETSLVDFPKGNETILLVDDEQMILDFGRELLQELGYKVLTAADGREALAAVREKKDDIDLIILDVVMPRMSGFEVWATIARENFQIKVIISSGHVPEDYMDPGGRQPEAFVAKPYRIGELADKVRQVLDS